MTESGNERVRVSVVMPFYGNRETVADTIGSVAAQTEPSWELIAVDDGSAPEDAAALRSAAGADPRVRVIRIAHAGVSAARNEGIRAAKGDWLCFLDADDRMERDALSVLLSMTDGGADIVCGAYRMDWPDGRSLVQACRDGGIHEVRDSLIRGDSALNSMCARLYRTETIRRNGIQAPVGIAVGEDVLFNLEAFQRARSWRMTDRVVYRYARGGESAMTQAERDRFRRSLPFIGEVGAFLQRNALKTEHFRAHLDLWLRTLRADRGRLRAALAFDRRAVRSVTGGVRVSRLSGKEKIYYAAIRAVPALSWFIP